MTRLRYLFASAAALSALAVVLCAGRAGTQGSSTEKVLPILSTSDVIGYAAPCG